MLNRFEEWYEIYKEDEGLLIATCLFPEHNIVPLEQAQKWFENRWNFIKKQLKLVNNQLTIYRCMRVDSNVSDSL
jgi:hypothetical protein